MGLLTSRPSATSFVVEDPYFLNIKEAPDWQRQFGNNHPFPCSKTKPLLMDGRLFTSVKIISANSPLKT